jgi:hypothetical protein
MDLLILSTIAFIYGRYLLSSIGFLAVGFGGSAIVWNGWSDRAGHLNSFAAFSEPVSLTYNEAFLLVTHAPFMAVGLGMLALSARKKR